MVYVAQSKRLVTHVKHIKEELSGADERSVFLSYDELLQQLPETQGKPILQESKEGSEPDSEAETHLRNWLSDYIAKYLDQRKAKEKGSTISQPKGKKALPAKLKSELAFLNNIPRIIQEFRLLSDLIYQPFEKYKNIGERNSLFPKLEHKSWIYAALRSYLEFLEHENIIHPAFYKVQAANIFAYLIGDEGQDFTPLQRRILFQLCKGKLNLTIDFNQAMKDSLSAMWSLQQLLGTDKAHYSFLPFSERCPNAVIRGASALLSIRRDIIGHDIDKLTETKLLEINQREGSFHWLDEKSELSHLPACEDNPDIAIIVDNYAKIAEAKALFKTDLVFLPAEIKGLEFKTIIYYQPLNPKYPKQSPEALLEQFFKEESQSAEKTKGLGDRLEGVCQLLQKLFVGFSRATENLVVYQSQNHRLKHFVGTIKERAQCKTRHIEKQEKAAKLTLLEKEKRYTELYHELKSQGLENQAKAIKSKAKLIEPDEEQKEETILQESKEEPCLKEVKKAPPRKKTKKPRSRKNKQKNCFKSQLTSVITNPSYTSLDKAFFDEAFCEENRTYFFNRLWEITQIAFPERSMIVEAIAKAWLSYLQKSPDTKLLAYQVNTLIDSGILALFMENIGADSTYTVFDIFIKRDFSKIAITYSDSQGEVKTHAPLRLFAQKPELRQYFLQILLRSSEEIAAFLPIDFLSLNDVSEHTCLQLCRLSYQKHTPLYLLANSGVMGIAFLTKLFNQRLELFSNLSRETLFKKHPHLYAHVSLHLSVFEILAGCHDGHRLLGNILNLNPRLWTELPVADLIKNNKFINGYGLEHNLASSLHSLSQTADGQEIAYELYKQNPLFAKVTPFRKLRENLNVSLYTAGILTPTLYNFSLSNRGVYFLRTFFKEKIIEGICIDDLKTKLPLDNPGDQFLFFSLSQTQQGREFLWEILKQRKDLIEGINLEMLLLKSRELSMHVTTMTADGKDEISENDDSCMAMTTNGMATPFYWLCNSQEGIEILHWIFDAQPSFMDAINWNYLLYEAPCDFMYGFKSELPALHCLVKEEAGIQLLTRLFKHKPSLLKNWNAAMLFSDAKNMEGSTFSDSAPINYLYRLQAGEELLALISHHCPDLGEKIKAFKADKKAQETSTQPKASTYFQQQTFFKRLNEQSLIKNRHNSLADQEAFDKCYGLVVKPS